jgi:hypothetical protein
MHVQAQQKIRTLDTGEYAATVRVGMIATSDAHLSPKVANRHAASERRSSTKFEPLLEIVKVTSFDFAIRSGILCAAGPPLLSRCSHDGGVVASASLDQWACPKRAAIVISGRGMIVLASCATNAWAGPLHR